MRGLFERKFTPKDRLLWLGDLNVAPTDLDVANPKNKTNHVCFHSDVKKAFADVMSWGFVDIFRKHLPGDGEYSFWDYRIKDSLSRNIGWRIDHIIGTEFMAGASRKEGYGAALRSHCGRGFLRDLNEVNCSKTGQRPYLDGYGL